MQGFRCKILLIDCLLTNKRLLVSKRNKLRRRTRARRDSPLVRVSACDDETWQDPMIVPRAWVPVTCTHTCARLNGSATKGALSAGAPRGRGSSAPYNKAGCAHLMWQPRFYSHSRKAFRHWPGQKNMSMPATLLASLKKKKNIIFMTLQDVLVSWYHSFKQRARL